MRALLPGVLALLAVPAALPVAAGTAYGQQPQAPQHYDELVSELARIREAATLEAAGDLAGAERIVRQVLESNPASLTALLTFERLLVVQGRAAELLPAVQRLIAVDPASVIGHQVRLRVHLQLGDVSGLESSIDRWIQSTPTIETPYREAAAAWRERREPRRAVAVLEQGRERIDRSDALALELGDAYADVGDHARAAAEWARAVGPEGRGFLLVQRRLQNQPDGGARTLPLLVDQLGAPPAAPGRQRAAALLAIDAGLEPRARRIAQELTGLARSEEREQVLVEMGRRADAAGLHSMAVWAYSELLRAAPDASATLAIRTRLAELALLAGDTAMAADVYRQLESAAAAGSPQRRQAMALRLQLAIGEGDLDGAAADFAAFRAEYPQAPETDGTAALLATRYLEQGDGVAAARLLEGVAGPRAAQARGRLFIRRGDLARAREELLAAAPLLQGREATETISLAALLSRLSPAGGDMVAVAIAADEVARPAILRAALEDTRRLAAAERAAVLDFLAGLADAAGLGEDADTLRREIVASLPRTHEAAGALLALARRASGRGEAAGEATVLLEKLIMEYPRSTLAPQARRELERLHGRRSTQ